MIQCSQSPVRYKSLANDVFAGGEWFSPSRKVHMVLVKSSGAKIVNM